MQRFVNLEKVVALVLVSPADNPLVTDDSRLVDVWFAGAPLRKQMFKKVKRGEQESLVDAALRRGFLKAGNLLIDPGSVLYAEMENELLGGTVTIGYGESGQPVEFKIAGKVFTELVAGLTGSADR